MRKDIPLARLRAPDDGGQDVGKVADIKVVVPALDGRGQSALDELDHHLRHVAVGIVARSKHAGEQQNACVQSARVHGVQRKPVRLRLGAGVVRIAARGIGAVGHVLVKHAAQRLGGGDLQKFCAALDAHFDNCARAIHGHGVKLFFAALADGDFGNGVNDDERPLARKERVKGGTVKNIAKDELRGTVPKDARRLFSAAGEPADAAALGEQFFGEYVPDVSRTAGHDIANRSVHDSIIRQIAPRRNCFTGHCNFLKGVL